MKKTIVVLAVTLTLLCGCQAKESADASDYGKDIEKAQEIAVISPDNSEVIDTITDNEEIGDFVSALDIDRWKLKSLPDEAVPVGSFGLAQEETVKLGQVDTDGTLYDVATITLYDGAYISLEMGGFDLAFEVSGDTADFLNGYFK